MADVQRSPQSILDSSMWSWVDDLLGKVDELQRKHGWSDEQVKQMLSNWELSDAWLEYVAEDFTR